MVTPLNLDKRSIVIWLDSFRSSALLMKSNVNLPKQDTQKKQIISD